METVIGKDPIFDALKKAGYEISTDQTPRTTKKKKMVDEGWKRFSLKGEELVSGDAGIWARLPVKQTENMLDRTRPFMQHCRGGGSVYEQDGAFYNGKGNQIKDFVMDW